jgi:hypothetical protein
MTTQRHRETSPGAGRSPALGIDIGRVLMCPAHDDGRPDTSFLSAGDEATALAVPAAPHVFDVVPALVRRFQGRAYLVSKAGARVEALTWRWLEHHRFFARTGLPAEQVRFCRRREDKRGHAVALGLSHFIDDRADVLGHLRGAVPHLFLFGVQTEPVPPFATHVLDWRAVAASLLDEQEPGWDLVG